MGIAIMAVGGIMAYVFMLYLLHLTVKFDRHIADLEVHHE